MDSKKYALLAHKMIFFGGMIITIYVLWNTLHSALLPFVAAWAISLPIRRLALRLSKKTSLSFKACAVICLVMILTTLLFLLKVGGVLLFEEILSLYGRLKQDPELILDFFCSVSNKLRSVGGIFSLFDGLSDNEALRGIAQGLEKFFSDAASRVVLSLGQKISEAAVNTASKIPGFFLFMIAFLTSCFYFSCDEGNISAFFTNFLPDDVQKRLPKLKKALRDVVYGYITSTFLLCLITFFIVLVGLLCVGSRYAVLLSLAIAIIDMLPLLGSGIILLPWSLICFICSDIRRGIALLIVWAVVTVVRQLAEPKLLGKRIGLHPLATLAAVYVGAKLFGFMGIVFGPLVAVGIKVFLPIFVGEKTK